MQTIYGTRIYKSNVQKIIKHKRKRFAIINCDNIIHCYGQKEVLQYIGYGNISTVHNLINRKSTIKNGRFKGYQVQRFEDVKMCEIVNK